MVELNRPPDAMNFASGTPLTVTSSSKTSEISFCETCVPIWRVIGVLVMPGPRSHVWPVHAMSWSSADHRIFVPLDSEKVFFLAFLFLFVVLLCLVLCCFV